MPCGEKWSQEHHFAEHCRNHDDDSLIVCERPFLDYWQPEVMHTRYI